jgi:hypothetical protein
MDRARLNTAARDLAAHQDPISDKWKADTVPFDGLDPVHLALSRLRRRRFDGAIEVATELLSRNALDQQVCVRARDDDETTRCPSAPRLRPILGSCLCAGPMCSTRSDRERSGRSGGLNAVR